MLSLLTNLPAAIGIAKEAATYKKYLPIINQVFQVIDPYVKKDLPNMSSSDIYQLVEKTVETVGDGKLSATEIGTVVDLVLAKFSIAKVADKPTATH